MVVRRDDVDVGIGPLINIERFNNIKKLIRVSAYILRFVWNMKSKLNGQEKRTDVLSTYEINQTEMEWLKFDQRLFRSAAEFPKVKSSLNIFEDDNGLLRSKTRISGAAELSK